MKIKHAAEFLGVTTRTLQRYDASGKLVPVRDEKNHRVYTHEQLLQFLKATKSKMGLLPAVKENDGKYEN